MLVDQRHRPGLAHDQFREPAGGNDARGAADLAGNAGDERFDQAGVAEDDPGLHARRRVRPDRAHGPHQVDPRQPGGALRERLDRDAQAGGDRSAEVGAVGGDGVEGRRGAEVDDDQGAAVPGEAADRVGDPVRAHLVRIVVANGDPGVRTRPEDEGLHAEAAFHRGCDRPGHHGHDGGDRRSPQAGRFEAAAAEELRPAAAPARPRCGRGCSRCPSGRAVRPRGISRGGCWCCRRPGQSEHRLAHGTPG